MTSRSIVLAVCSLALTACASNPGSPRAGSLSSKAVAPDIVWFTGASNIRHFSCRSASVSVYAEAAPEDIERARADGMPVVRSAALAIPVGSLDCGIHKMNKDLRETLGGDMNPTISFRLGNYVLIGGEKENAARMNGLLTIAGHEKALVLYGNVFRDANGGLRLRGDRLIDVRDYGVKPPRRFFGLLHVGNEITVHFDVAVRPLIDPLGTLATVVSIKP